MQHQRIVGRVSPARIVFPDLVDGGQGAKPIVVSGQSAAPISDHRAELDEKAGSIKVTTMSFQNMSQYGELFVEFLRARRAVFIDRLHWNLPQSDGMEFDQYDTPQARWVAVHEYGKVLGGVRLMPTTARCAAYSYMLRDAQRGLLGEIPRDVLFFDAPEDPRTWEATRLFISEEVDADRRSLVQRMLMSAMQSTAAQFGATSVIGIVPAVFARWLKRIGMEASPVGPKFSIDGTWSQAALFPLKRLVQ